MVVLDNVWRLAVHRRSLLGQMSLRHFLGFRASAGDRRCTLLHQLVILRHAALPLLVPVLVEVQRVVRLSVGLKEIGQLLIVSCVRVNLIVG